MVVDPLPTARARPAVLMVATPAAVELHVAVLVRFWVLPSLYVPVAVNCCVLPLAIDGFAGVTAMETRVAAVTVSVVLPETAPEVACMDVDPLPTAVATPAAVELHVAVLVRFWVPPSLYIPVAVNCCVLPLVIDGFAGVTATDTSVAAGV